MGSALEPAEKNTALQTGWFQPGETHVGITEIQNDKFVLKRKKGMKQGVVEVVIALWLEDSQGSGEGFF